MRIRQALVQLWTRRRRRILLLTVFWIVLLIVSAPFDASRIDALTQVKEGVAVHPVIYYVFWALLIVLSYVAACLAKRPDEKTFAQYALLFGLLFVFATPFPGVLDEPTHYYKAFSITQGHFLDENRDGVIGNELPANYYRTYTPLSSTAKLLEPLSTEKVFARNAYTSSIIPINHTILAVGLKIGQLLRWPVAWSVYFGRLCGYLIYVLLAFCAIRNATYYKSVFFTVSCFSTALYLAGTFSTDPLLIGGALLFTSLCLKYAFGAAPTFSARDGALMVVSMILFCSVKYCGYSPLLLLFLLIPKTSFRPGQRRTMLWLFGLILLGLVIWQIALLKMFPYYEDRNGHTDIREQLAYILSHPAESIGVFIKFFATSAYAGLQDLSSIYTAIGAWGPALSFLLVCSAGFAPDGYDFPDLRQKRLFRSVFLGVFIVISCITVASLFLAFTPVGASSIIGVQTRYFIPQMPLMMIVMAMTRGHLPGFRRKVVFVSELCILLTLGGLLLSW